MNEQFVTAECCGDEIILNVSFGTQGDKGEDGKSGAIELVDTKLRVADQDPNVFTEQGNYSFNATVFNPEQFGGVPIEEVPEEAKYGAKGEMSFSWNGRADGRGSVAMSGGTAYGDLSLSIGGQTNGEMAVALIGSTADGNRSMAVMGSTAREDYQFALGGYTDNVADTAVIVGAGEDVGKNRFMVYKDGGLGLLDTETDEYKRVEVKDSKMLVDGKEMSLTQVDTIDDLRKLDGKEGNIITLLGYYTKGDKASLNYIYKGGDYVDNGGSIIVSGLGAWFMTSDKNISILDFGIVNDNTINQSNKLDAHAKYCDENNIYEIDYLGYHIQTSRTIHQTTARGSRLTGICFNKTHKLKNLIIQHDKSLNLYQGASLILWLIDYIPTEEETFELDNVTFDPYNANYTIINGEGDGRLGGFYASKIGSVTSVPTIQELNFVFKLNNIHFITPAISRNISTADIRFKETQVSNLTGEYWALYTHIFATNSNYENVKCTYRNDLQNGSSRILVLTMIHHEPETSTYEVDLDSVKVKNCESKDTLGVLSTVYKHHTVDNSLFRIKNIEFDNILGYIAWSLSIYSYCDNLIIKNIKRQLSEFSLLGLNPYNISIESSIIPNIQGLLANKSKNIVNFNVTNCTITRCFNFLSGAVSTITNMNLLNVDIDKNAEFDTSGILRNVATVIDNLKVINVKNRNQRFIDCIIKNTEINGFYLNDTLYGAHFVLRGNDLTKKLIINNLFSTALPLGVDNFIANSGTGNTLVFDNYTNSTTMKRIGLNAASEISVYPVRSYATGALPVLNADQIGYKVYDSSFLSYKIWNGTTWLLDSVKASTAVANSTATLPTADTVSIAVDVPALVTDFNDLVGKYNIMVTLVTDLQSKLNAKLTADRNSGQQA